MTKPDFRVFATPQAVADAVARYMAEALQARPAITLGLATGKTFVPIYEALVSICRDEGLSFAEAASFNLDEYVGLAPDHKATFRRYMEDNLFRHVDLPAERALLPDASENAGADYERGIAARGGIDLQLLGIGRNGHIGFNEPGSGFDSRTRVVTLTPSTIAANTSDFPPGEVPPPEAITMGIGTILEAREIVLVATGAAKAEALSRAFFAQPDVDCPASALQRHGHVTVFCDEAAHNAIVQGDVR
jgi:glucosamine-6-phosphate deaminase